MFNSYVLEEVRTDGYRTMSQLRLPLWGNTVPDLRAANNPANPPQLGLGGAPVSKQTLKPTTTDTLVVGQIECGPDFPSAPALDVRIVVMLPSVSISPEGATPPPLKPMFY